MRCFVCGKEGCVSYNHTEKERKESKNRLKKKFDQRFDKGFRQYPIDCEGEVEVEDLETDDLSDEFEALMVSINDNIDLEPPREQPEHYLISFGTIAFEHALQASTCLANRAFEYSLTRQNPLAQESQNQDPFTYATRTTTAGSRYTSETFYGIMIDTGASTKSTAS